MVREKASFDVISRSSEETFRLGKILGMSLRYGDVVALTGELGSGKTVLTQGIAQGLGVPTGYVVTSPTFTLINEYPGNKTRLYHLDLYRLNGASDLAEVGYEECILSGGVMVIEWAEKILDAIPDGALFIALSYIDDHERRIRISGGGDAIDLLQQACNEGGC